METSNFERTTAEAVQPVAAADMRKPLFKAGSIRSRRSRERFVTACAASQSRSATKNSMHL